MAKTIVVNEIEQTRVPFLRGILTRSLQDSGLEFDQAFELATEIRETLGDRGEIDSNDLRRLVAGELSKRFDGAVLERFQAPPSPPVTVLVRDQNDLLSAFSRGRHQLYLESCGLSPMDASHVTGHIYQQLLQDGVKEIRTCELGLKTYNTLKDSIGESAARRYLVWTEFLQSERPLLLIIGGTVGSGKSTVATEIAHRLGIVRTQSTDLLREVMRMMIPKRLVPVLHESSFNAWKALPFAEDGDQPSERMLAEGFQSQAELLNVPFEAVINRALRERVSLILEGVHMRPSQLELIDSKSDAIVVFVTLAVLSPKALKRRIRGRTSQAPQRRAKRYLKHFESIWQLQAFMLDDADRNDVPIISNEDKDRAVQQILATINRKLRREYHGTPEAVFQAERDDD